MVSQPMDLEKLSVDKFKKVFDSFDVIFSDIDGVIWASTPLPRVGEFFELSKQLGKKVHFVSNNSIRTKENYRKLFQSVGIEDGMENLTYPSIAISEYLKSLNFDKHVYCVCCDEAKLTMESYGIKCKSGPDVGHDNYLDFVEYLEDDPDIGAVVFDSDFKVNLAKLYKAITYLRRPDVIFLSGASDKYVPMKSGSVSMGTGIFTDIVEDKVKRHAIHLGKPAKAFGDTVMKKTGFTDPSRVLFIGDMLEQDVGLGKASGFQTLLVLTNCSRDMAIRGKLIPDYISNGLGQLVPQLEKLLTY